MNPLRNPLKDNILQLLFFLSPVIILASCLEHVTDQERDLEPFHGINVGAAFEVILTQSGRHKVVIEASEEVAAKVRTEVKRGVLHIDMDWTWSWGSNDDVTVYLDFDQLESLVVSGAGNVTATTPIKVNNLDLKVSGAGDLDLEVDAASLDVRISGAGDVTVSGQTESQKVRLSGAGDYKARNLRSNYTNARASGAGSVTVLVDKEIEAYASGAGTIRYYGDPEKKHTDATGAGSILPH